MTLPNKKPRMPQDNQQSAGALLTAVTLRMNAAATWFARPQEALQWSGLHRRACLLQQSRCPKQCSSLRLKNNVKSCSWIHREQMCGLQQEQQCESTVFELPSQIDPSDICHSMLIVDRAFDLRLCLPSPALSLLQSDALFVLSVAGGPNIEGGHWGCVCLGCDDPTCHH